MLNGNFVVQFNAKFPNLGIFCLKMGIKKGGGV